MLIYVVYYFEHYDDYKRAESFGDVLDVFTNEESAYALAVNCFIAMFKENNLTDFDDYDILVNKTNILYKTLTFKEKYVMIKDKLYDKILPPPDYTMQPTHQNYCVKEFDV